MGDACDEVRGEEMVCNGEHGDEDDHRGCTTLLARFLDENERFVCVLAR
jgi:hypothetical protein